MWLLEFIKNTFYFWEVKFESELLWIRTWQRRTAYLETREIYKYLDTISINRCWTRNSFLKLPFMLEHPGCVSICNPTESISSSHWWQLKIFMGWRRRMKAVCGSHFKNWVEKADFGSLGCKWEIPLSSGLCVHQWLCLHQESIFCLIFIII